MKLENNSLKYGMNSANNANNAFSNAYNQEMANQRDMQGQVTQRQKTLLEAAVQEANYKQQERDRVYGYNPQTKTFAKVYDPSNPNAYDIAINKTIENNTQPFRTIVDNTVGTLPTWTETDENGNILPSRQSVLPFSGVSQGVMYHPDELARAKALGLSPEDYNRRMYPLAVQQKGKHE